MYAGHGFNSASSFGISLIKIKDGRHADHLVLALGEWPRRRSGMSDLHETRDPESGPELDTAGWLFSAVAVAIIAAATMAAYKAHDTTVANVPVPQVVVR
jgi:hypothetical protein